MKELYEYREKLLERFREDANEFCEACRSYTEPFTSLEEGWNVHQIAFHVRDVNREVYGVRIRRTLTEKNPIFKNFDPDVWMAEHYNRDEALENILSDFQTDMKELHTMLKQAAHEAWSQTGTHEALGPDLTMQLWVERSVAHLEEHLKTLKSRKK